MCTVTFFDVNDVVNYIEDYKENHNGIGPRFTAKSNKGKIEYTTILNLRQETE